MNYNKSMCYFITLLNYFVYRSTTNLTSITFFILGFALCAEQTNAGPFVKVNVRKTHLEVEIDNEFPQLTFFDTKNLKGKPTLELNTSGLYISGKLVCSWPEGKFRNDKKDDSFYSGMVLGFGKFDPMKSDYKPCPTHQPVISTVSEAGAGRATLYVEVERINGDLLEAKIGKKSIYLSLKSIPAAYTILPPNSLSNIGD